MINYDTQIVSLLTALGTTPVRYELQTDSDFTLPCITWRQTGNATNRDGGSVRTSYIDYAIKVWSHDPAANMTLGQSIDTAMYAAGFKRQSAQTLSVDSTYCLILNYEGNGLEY